MASTSVRIKDPNAASPPEILTPLRNVLGLENRNVQFQCTILGNPLPSITWFKGMREISHSSKYSTRKEGDTYFLVVNDVFGKFFIRFERFHSHFLIFSIGRIFQVKTPTSTSAEL
jgi:hypothetical protein